MECWNDGKTEDRSQNTAHAPAAGAASLIEQKTSKKNIAYRRKEPFEILRFDILLFCGSLFRPGEASYKHILCS
jgi:hypothetical protein